VGSKTKKAEEIGAANSCKFAASGEEEAEAEAEAEEEEELARL
jgi:hypothetical protein